MPKYSELEIAVLTMPKDDLNEAAGIIADWAARLLNGQFEDDETGEDRHYAMPVELRPHLEVLNSLRERVAELLDAIDNFGGYFPTDGEVAEGHFLVEFYESEAFANAPKVSVTVLADSPDAVNDSARAINEWAVLMLRAGAGLPQEIVASLQSLLGLNFWVSGLIEALSEALCTESADLDAASRYTVAGERIVDGRL